MRVPLTLVPGNLLRHKVRSLLTVLSLAVAVLLVSNLFTVIKSLNAGVEAASEKRLVVQSAVSLFVILPESYEAKIEAVDGVETVAKWQWFGGYYRDRSNFFAQFAVEADRLLAIYPEFEIVDGSVNEFVHNRDTCLIGVDLVKKYGFKVGDTIPLIGTIFPRTDGGSWQLRVAGVYRSRKNDTINGSLYFHFSYLSESLDAGAARGPKGVGVYFVRLAPGARAEVVMRRIDALFENGPQRVQTTTEAEFSRQFVTMLGSVPTFLGSIGAGVLFAILLAVLNTMLMAARERTRELGVLKAMGFSDSSLAVLLLFESLLLGAIGGLLGAAATKAVEPLIRARVGTALPAFAISAESLAVGVGLALGVGLLAGIVPALRARRLLAVDALRTV